MTQVSVLTVVRDGMPHLAKALSSLHEQTHREIQHVAVDACSEDGTTQELRRAAPDVHIVEPDDGLYDALNKALEYATGDVVGFLHSDDMYASQHVLSRIAGLFDADPDLDMVLTDIVYVDDRERIVRRYRSDRFSPERLRWGWMPAHTGMYATRELYERVGGFKTDYEIGADYEWLVRAFVGGPVRFTYLPLVSMLMRVGGRSTRGLTASVTLNREVMRACRENGLSTSYSRLLSKYPIKVLDKYARR